MKNSPSPLYLHILFAGMLLGSSQTERIPWTDLLTENGLEDFTQRGGPAVYGIHDGIITGTTPGENENSFLCTRETYGDFILEFKVLADTAVNSGIQIRSHAYQNGRVHGYQVEIDEKRWREWSGGIYDEARRKWLNDLSGNIEGSRAFRAGEWNQYRIEAIGNSIKTWINGTMCANLVDDADPSGFIAFQVHGVNTDKKPWAEGVTIQWKDIRILTGELEAFRTPGPDPVPPTITLLHNMLTDSEVAEGWELLFDGTGTEKWRGAHKEDFPLSGWKAEDGLMVIQAGGGGESAEAGDIVTIEEFADFELKLDFKLSPGANSGIKYYVTEKERVDGSAIGLEYQLLDDALHPDADNGKDGNRTLASLYDLIPAGGKKYVRETGMWNMARIISNNGHVEHWLNGEKVLEYERGSEAYRALVAASKYRNWTNFGEAESGHILLQEHGHDVAFRNIKIKRL
jgi:hypothetical protein